MNRNTGALIERGIGIALCAATLATALLLGLNRISPAGPDAWFPLAIWLVYGVGFATLGAAAALAVAIASRFVGSLSRLFVVVLGGISLAVALLANASGAAAIGAIDGSVRFQLCGAVALACAIGGTVTMMILPAPSRSVPRLFVAALLASTLVALIPSRRDAQEPPAIQASSDAVPLLLIGLDAADWSLLDRLIARGEVPHLAALKARGAWGPLTTIEPTFSPLIWSTVVTGRGPLAHGIEAFRVHRFPGLYRDFAGLAVPRGFALPRLHRWLERLGVTFQTTFTSADRRVPAYWEIASRAGRRVAVYNWWASWPAEPVDGFLVSERIHFAQWLAAGVPATRDQLTYPPDLYREVEPLIVNPQDVTLADARRFADVTPVEFAEMPTSAANGAHGLKSELKHVASMFQTDRHVARLLLRKAREAGDRPTTFLLYFRILDQTCHLALKYSELVDDHLDASREELAKYAHVVTEAYRRADALVGELLDEFGDGNVMIVSDHGFRLEQHPDHRPYYDHDFAPPGIFVASGPAFRPGRVDGLSVFDVFPTMLFLTGLPVAEDLEGRVALDAIGAEYAAQHPPRRIETYGPEQRERASIAASPADEPMIDRLRALGYVK